MNPLDRMLQDELNRLLDRLAATVPEGAIGELSDQDPQLRALIERAEGRLSAVRAALLDGYQAWREAIEECENLWAVGGLKCAEAATPAALRAA